MVTTLPLLARSAWRQFLSRIRQTLPAEEGALVLSESSVPSAPTLDELVVEAILHGRGPAAEWAQRHCLSPDKTSLCVTITPNGDRSFLSCPSSSCGSLFKLGDRSSKEVLLKNYLKHIREEHIKKDKRSLPEPSTGSENSLSSDGSPAHKRSSPGSSLTSTPVALGFP